MAKMYNRTAAELQNLPDDELITLTECTNLLHISRVWWRKGINDGTFPEPFIIGLATKRWMLGEVRALMSEGRRVA